MKKSIIAIIMLILLGTSINSIAYEPQTKVSGYMDTEGYLKAMKLLERIGLLSIMGQLFHLKFA